MKSRLLSVLLAWLIAAALPAQAAEPGAADFAAGIVALEGADPDGAARHIRKAAEAGHPGAMYQLGILHAQGYGVEKSVPECIRWHRAAAEAGYADAMYDLGWRHSRGLGLPLDHAEKFRWWQRATEAGHPVAPHEIALAHGRGEGTPASDTEAIRWLERGAALGNADSMATLGWHYAQGKGVPADPAKAHAWSLKAAQAGQVGAMFAVGLNFERGHGTAQNDQQAVHWYGRAARQNHPEAVKNLAALRAAGRDKPASTTQVQAKPAEAQNKINAAQKTSSPPPAPVAKSTPVPRPAAPVVAAAKPPAPAPTAVAKPASQLSPITRDAADWEAFFAASARRDVVTHRQHDPDVRLFLEKHPATTEQLRAAYRRARDAFRPTPGTVRGRQLGGQFVAYHLAILATGLSGQAAANFVRDDFQALTRSDVQNAQQVLMGLDRPNLALFRPFLTPQQNQQVRDLADLVLKRQPLPTVPDPSTSAATTRSVATTKSTPPTIGTPGQAGDDAETQRTLAGLVEAIISAAGAKDWAKAINNSSTALVLAQKRGTARQLELVKETRQLLAEEVFTEALTSLNAGDTALMLTRLEQAASLAHPGAHYMLALAYAEGIAVEENLNNAREWMHKAADLGFDKAKTALAEPPFALEPGESEFAQAETLRKAGDLAAALPLFKQAATLGHTEAAYAVGEAYLDGKGVARDLALASDWIELSQENHRKNPNTRNKLMAESAHVALIGAKLQAGMINAGGTQVKEALAHVDANNYPAAAAAFRAAAALGNLNGMRSLGILYMNGQGVKLDFDESRKWFQRALAFDHPQAAADLRALENKARLFDVGQKELAAARAAREAGDPAATITSLKQAAAKGSTEARFELGVAHEKGEGVPRDLAIAIEYYEQAGFSAPARAALERLAAAAPGGAELALARTFARDQPAWFLALATSAADQGNTFAMMELARHHAAFNVGDSLDRALDWYQKAADAGHRSAAAARKKLDDEIFDGKRQQTLEERMLDRQGGGSDDTRQLPADQMREIARHLAPKDPTAAHAWLRRAVDAGDTTAMLILANETRQTDPSASIALIQQAADAGNADAKLHVGMMRFQGQGLPQDQAAGRRLIAEAADGGSIQAQLLYGEALLTGNDGVTADPARGRAYLEKVAAQKEIPQVAAHAAELLRRFAQHQAQQNQQRFESIWANPETRFQELTALYAAAKDKAPIVEFFAEKILPAWQESTVANAYKPLREVVSAHYAIINTMAEPENSQARSLLYFSVHRARLAAEKSGQKYPDFLYNWIRPKTN